MNFLIIIIYRHNSITITDTLFPSNKIKEFSFVLIFAPGMMYRLKGHCYVAAPMKQRVEERIRLGGRDLASGEFEGACQAGATTAARVGSLPYKRAATRMRSARWVPETNGLAQDVKTGSTLWHHASPRRDDNDLDDAVPKNASLKPLERQLSRHPAGKKK